MTFFVNTPQSLILGKMDEIADNMRYVFEFLIDTTAKLMWSLTALIISDAVFIVDRNPAARALQSAFKIFSCLIASVAFSASTAFCISSIQDYNAPFQSMMARSRSLAAFVSEIPYMTA